MLVSERLLPSDCASGHDGKCHAMAAVNWCEVFAFACLDQPGPPSGDATNRRMLP